MQILIQDSERAPPTVSRLDGSSPQGRRSPPKLFTRILVDRHAVMHRANIDHIEDMVALALALGASRVEIVMCTWTRGIEELAARRRSAKQERCAGDGLRNLCDWHHGDRY